MDLAAAFNQRADPARYPVRVRVTSRRPSGADLDAKAPEAGRMRRGRRAVADRVAVADVARDLLEGTIDVGDVARGERRAAARLGELLQAFGVGLRVQGIDERDGVDDDVRRLRLRRARRNVRRLALSPPSLSTTSTRRSRVPVATYARPVGDGVVERGPSGGHERARQRVPERVRIAREGRRRRQHRTHVVVEDEREHFVSRIARLDEGG